MNDAIKTFLGKDLVATLLPPQYFDPTSEGKRTEVVPKECVDHVRKMSVTPLTARKILASNEWYQETKGKIANRVINQPRIAGELPMICKLMTTDQFTPHQASLGITLDGRGIEGQGRLLSQIKTEKTYDYLVDVVKSEQRYVAAYLSASRGTTASMSPAQLWEITFGLKKKQASLAQQIYNGLLWHEEGILGAGVRSSTKEAICEKTSLEADLREVVDIYASLKSPRNVNLAALATIELLARRKGFSEKKITDFRIGFITGANLGARDPRKVIRDGLIQRSKGKTMRYQAQIGYMKYAFDKFITGSDTVKFISNGIVKF